MKNYIEECPAWSFPAEYETEHKPCLKDYVKDERAQRFIRRNGVLLIALLALIVWTWAVHTISYHNGKVDMREELAPVHEQEIAAAVQAVRDEYAAKTFVSGEASRNAAIAAEAKHLAKIGQGLLNTYKGADLEDAKKVMLCAVCRVLAGGEFAGIKSIEQACKAENQWWGYADAYTQEVYKAAQEIATIYETGEALPCPVDMVFAGWNGEEIMLRNQWEANAQARYW